MIAGKGFNLAGGLVALLLLAGCVTNTITGRQQVLMYGEAEDAALGLQALNEVKATAPVVTQGPQAARIIRLGHRIAAVSHKPDLDWEFLLIDEPLLNAWALPGGKVAIYSKMAESFDDEELAAVMGHEVAHAVLRHGVERISRVQLTQIGVNAGAAVAGAATKSTQVAQVAVALGGLAANGFITLPHSRFTELEADDIGALYMARAGYDPRAAIRLWQKMGQLKEGQGAPPTFFSTHPNDGQRIERLREKMPAYLDVYRAARR